MSRLRRGTTSAATAAADRSAIPRGLLGLACEPTCQPDRALLLVDVALTVGAVACQQRACSVELLACREPVGVGLKRVEQRGKPLAGRDTLTALEVDEPAAHAVTARPPRVLLDPV